MIEVLSMDWKNCSDEATQATVYQGGPSLKKEEKLDRPQIVLRFPRRDGNIRQLDAGEYPVADFLTHLFRHPQISATSLRAGLYSRVST